MEESAFVSSVPALRKAALSASRRAGATTEEAEDVAQEILLRLWQMRGDLARFRSLEAVTARMAHNLTLNLHRRLPTQPLGEPLPAHGYAPSPQKALEEAEDERWLAVQLAKLPATEHTVLRLRQVEHRSHADIARLLGISEGSVSTLLARARRKLLEEIRKRNAQ